MVGSARGRNRRRRRQRVRLVQFATFAATAKRSTQRKVSVLLAEQHFITSLGVTGGGIARDGARLIERGTGGNLRQFGQNIPRLSVMGTRPSDAGATR